MMTPTHPWHTLINQALKTLPSNAFMLDAGTSARFAKEMRLFKPQLKTQKYFALGFKPDSKVNEPCDLNGDLTQLPVKTEALDCLICLEVLEHVNNPITAAAEIYRVLRPGGILILTTPFLSPYHGRGGLGSFAHDNYPDFWRFTHQGLMQLFSSFSQVDVFPLTTTFGFYLEQIAKIPLSAWGLSHLKPFFTHTPPTATARHLVIARK